MNAQVGGARVRDHLLPVAYVIYPDQSNPGHVPCVLRAHLRLLERGFRYPRSPLDLKRGSIPIYYPPYGYGARGDVRRIGVPNGVVTGSPRGGCEEV